MASATGRSCRDGLFSPASSKKSSLRRSVTALGRSLTLGLLAQVFPARAVAAVTCER